MWTVDESDASPPTRNAAQRAPTTTTHAGQVPPPLVDPLTSDSDQLLLSLLTQFCALRTVRWRDASIERDLSLASAQVSGEAAFRDDCWRGARALRRWLEQFGWSVLARRPTATNDARAKRSEARLVEGAHGKNPLVFARTPRLPNRPTVIFYGHCAGRRLRVCARAHVA